MTKPVKVAEIITPAPPALQQTENGAITEGEVYSLTLPLVATEPVVIKHSDGSTLTMCPRELFFRDENGELDPIVDSSPVSVATGTRHVRYERVYPLCDDTYAAEPERIKHYITLARPPREPAAYLIGKVEFGFSWTVEYRNSAGIVVPLPSGKTESMILGPFTLSRPHADDLSYSEKEPDRRTHGYFEVVDTDEGQVLFAWFDAAWFFDGDRRYPVTVDPTVVTKGVGVFTRHHIVTLPNSGRQVALIQVTGGHVCYVSDDHGQTWQLCTSPANGIVTTLTGVSEIDADQNDAVIMLVGDSDFEDTQPLKLLHIKFSGLDATITETEIEPAPPTNYCWVPQSLIVVSSTPGGTTRIAFGYTRSASMYNGTEYWRRRVGDISTDGTWTQLWYEDTPVNYGSHDRYYGLNGHLCRLGNGDVWEILSNSYDEEQYNTLICRKRVGEADWAVVYVLSNLSNLSIPFVFIGMDGFDKPFWIAQNGKIYDDTGAFYSGNVWSQAGMSILGEDYYQLSVTAVGDPENNRIILIGKSASTGCLRMAFFDIATKTVYDARDLDSSIQIKKVSGPRHFDGVRYPILMQEKSTDLVYSYTITFNSPPLEPTISVPAAFDAADGLTLTIHHNDPDPGDVASGIYLKIGEQWWNGSGLVTDKPASPLPGGSTDVQLHIAGIWTAGQTYQLYASTVDAHGVEGPLSSVPTIVKASAKPIATVTTPTPGEIIPYSHLTVVATQTTTSGVSPAAYKVTIYDNLGTTLFTTTYESSGALNVQVNYELPNGLSGQVGVIPIDSDGLAGEEVLVPFTVQFTPPVLPVISASAGALGGYVEIAVQNGTPVDPQPNVAYNDVYRRPLGSTTWTRIATNIPPNTAYQDYAVASNQTYEYMIKAVGENGTVSSSNIVTATVTIPYGLWLHDPLDPSGTAHFFEYYEANFQDSPKLSAGDFMFAGRTYPVTQFNAKAMERPVKFRLALPKDTDDLAALENLFYRRTTLCLRDARGRKLYGTIKELPITDEKWGATADIEFTVVDYREGV